METNSKIQEREVVSSPVNSPNSNVSSSNSNGTQLHTPPLTPKPISRSETNPYPTTFVQADTTAFKQVVQMLTGSSETAKQASHAKQPQPDPPSSKVSIPPIKTGQKKQGFKLYERRNTLKNGLIISPSMGHNHRMPEILSPSILDFPSLVLSPVTPLIQDPFNRSSQPQPHPHPQPLPLPMGEEEKAIAQKGFYLHPSPMSTPRASEPQLLPLFPVTSPRLSGSSI